MPGLGFQDPDARLLNPGFAEFMGAVRWLATDGPPEMRYLADNPRFRRPAHDGAR